jgi:hypothetical protein
MKARLRVRVEGGQGQTRMGPHLSEDDLIVLPLTALWCWLGCHQHDIVALERNQWDWEGS